MKPIYEVDYPSLVVEYKKKFVYELSDLAETSFAGQPFEVQLLAQTLIFTRWWNSYQHMAPEEPAPEILGIAIDILWDFLEGNCGIEEFSRFQKSFFLVKSSSFIHTGKRKESCPAILILL